MEWLFAYGSLLPAHTAALPAGLVPCRLRGWQRSWGVAMDNSADLPGYKHYLAPDGTRPDVMVAFLNVDPEPGAETNGVVIPVGAEELPGLDTRERNYERAEVTGQIDPVIDGRVWVYRGLAAARGRAGRGRAEGRLVVARDYRETVLAGFERIGQRQEFEAGTGPCPEVEDLHVVYAVEPTAPRRTR
jgi:cation transport regulator ChaC